MMAAQSESYQVTWIILNAVKHIHAGRIRLAEFLKGSKSKDVRAISSETIYGGLMWYTISTIKGFIEQLESMNLIQKKVVPGHPYDYAVFELTDAGRLVLEKKQQIPLQIIREAKPITAGNSEKETYELFKNGKTIPDIARQRDLTVSTIYSHVYRLIATGYMSSHDVIPEEIINKVKDAASKLSEPSVKHVKGLLPEVSYDEIRCVLAEVWKKDKKDEN